MFGYPITPQNEVMHYWDQISPKYGRGFLQTEDEISAWFYCLWCGSSVKKAFTATAGLGNVLMRRAFWNGRSHEIAISGCYSAKEADPHQEPNYMVPTTGSNPYNFYKGNGEGHRVVYSTAPPRNLRLHHQSF